MNTCIRRLALASLSVALVGCAAGGSDTGGNEPLGGDGVIRGKITGPTVAGVSVQLVGAVDSVTTTDGAGSYSFVGVPDGDYYVIPVASRQAHFTPPRARVTSDGGDEAGIDFTSRIPPDVSGFAPTDIGSELWAWGWAGSGGANLATVGGNGGDFISFMADLSGNGRHFFNNTNRKAGYEPSIRLGAGTMGGPYESVWPVIGVDRFTSGVDHFGSVYYQSTDLAATAGFYLVVAMVNTRDAGVRELFGTDDRHFMRMDQSNGDVYMTLNGVEKKIARDVPHGPLVLEIWRDNAGDITVMENGLEVTDGAIRFSGRFDVSGFGFDQSGTSYFDDYLMEIVMCDALPPQVERDQIREYLRVKWDLY